MATTKVTTDVIDMSGNTGGLVWAKGATGDQPAVVDSTAGDLRENTTTGRTEVFNGTAWRNLKEAAVVLTVDFLVVAGGGAGAGSFRAGAGGAGGLKTTTTYSGSEAVFSASLATAYTIKVGAGGTAVSNSQGGNGEDSKFGTVGSEIISTGGGGGGYYAASQAGSSGGSGGGSAGLEPSVGSIGAGGAASPAGQGNAGGQGASSSSVAGGGGGGGAGAVGNNYGTGATDGDGGVGLQVNIDGLNNYYSGGGGGGNYGAAYGNETEGGQGGGGAGGRTAGVDAGVAGSPNTGGGGGGSSYSGVGSTGGSGIVILRCTKATATISAGITVNSTAGPGSVSGDTTNMPSGEYFYSATLGTGTITFS